MNQNVIDEKTLLKKQVTKRILMIIINLLFSLAILLVSSGDYLYRGAWILLGVYIISITFFGIFLPKKVIETRSKSLTNQPTYEKVLKIPLFISGYATYIVAGLDQRFNWTIAIPWYMLVLGAVIFFMGMGILLWSMIENPYFNQAVTLDEDHQVVTSGPYSVIRHPGYLGMMTYLAVVPILLESLFAMIPTIVVIILFMIRTNLEDKYLANHLKGYKAYQEQVKKRLFRTYRS